MIILIILGWYMVGILAFITAARLIDSVFTVGDLIISLFAGLMGPVCLIYIVCALTIWNTRPRAAWLDKRIWPPLNGSGE
jgi:hypothetical protein